MVGNNLDFVPVTKRPQPLLEERRVSTSPRPPLDLAVHVEDRSARGIAAAISRLIRSGALQPGEKLPTVRALARDLATSPTTVSEAWQLLGRIGAIEARGRLGTFVRDDRRPVGSRRYRTVTQRPSQYALDLSTGVPDPDLLPDVRRALERISRRNLTTSYLDAPLLPALEELLRAQWPFVPELLTVVDGAMDALDRILSSVARIGDTIAVEDPGFPPILDLVEQIGATAVPVTLDDEGIIPADLVRALTTRPVALILQPRAHNPTGTSMSPRRTAELARVLASSAVIVIEDDHSGDIAWAPPVSLGSFLPERTVHIRSFSKSHGPDLRLAAVGGSGNIISQVVERRLLGPGWSSRLLQAVLLEMLRDPHTVQTVADARDEYANRRSTMSERLRSFGVGHRGSDGINMWVDVADERSALLSLAVRGIGVAPGTPFEVAPSGGAHLRVTVGLVADEHEQVAQFLAEAAHGYPPTPHR